MKSWRIITSALLVIAAAAFTSCGTGGFEPTPIPTPDPEDWVCPHDSLFFVRGVEPTETTNGVAEHYECAFCHEMFLDEDCDYEIDSDILWATGYVLGLDEFYDDFYLSYEDVLESFAETYYEEGETFALSPILMFLFEKVIKPKLGDIFKALFAFHDDKGKSPQIDPNMKALLDKLSEIEGAISNIAHLLQEAEINRSIDKRQYELQAIRLSTQADFKYILDLTKGYKEGDTLPESVKNAIKEDVDEWYKEGIIYDDKTRTGIPYYCISKALEGINGSWSGQRTFPQLYDHIAQRTTPWAHEGNAIREMMRAVDILTLSEAYIMLSLYYEFHNNERNKSRYEEIRQKMEMYYNCMQKFEVNPIPDNVVRWWWHDYNGGSKLDLYAMDKEIFTFSHIDYNLKQIEGNEDYRFDKIENLKKIVRNNVTVGGILEQKDYKLIYEYYHKSDPNKKFYDMIASAGFKGLKTYDEGGRIAYDEEYHAFNGESPTEKTRGVSSYLYFSAANYKNEHFGISTALDQEFKRMGYGKNYYRKDVAFSTYHPVPRVFRVLYLINMGKRTELVLEGISRKKETGAYEPYVKKNTE